MWNVDDPWLMRYEDVLALGHKYGQEHPGAFEEMLAQGSPQDIAIFSYTSGTSGAPKGAMISHSNLLYATWQTRETAPFTADDDYVSFSPLAWITEQSLGVGAHAINGFKVNFPEGPETVQHDLREIAPSSLLFPSRLWEGLARTMQMRVNDSFWINRALFHLFLPIAYKVIDLEDERKPIPVHLRFLRWVGRLAVLGPLRDKIGMTRMRHAFTSGAALSPSVLRFFRAVGVEPARSLWLDRDTGRDAASGGAGQAGDGRRTEPRHVDQDRRGQRNPRVRSNRVRRLLQDARQDARGV
ncbi:MAG: AMP-binding protein [Chloroflexi bacterium]|nr:AMP-binding protein [Chloroflexota bacterium]